MRPNPPLWGIENWPRIYEIAGLVLEVAFLTVFIRRSRRLGRLQPALVLVLALTAVGVWDPLANWVSFSAFDPRLLHFPTDWPYVSLAPTVEPFVNLIAYPYYVLIPVLPAAWLYRRMSLGKDRPGGRLARRPLAWLFLLGALFGAFFDAAMENLLIVRSEVFIWSQIPGPAVRAGQTWQFPLLWEPLLWSIVNGTAAMLLWRDDSGRTLGGRIAQRSRMLRRGVFRRRPALAEVAVAFSMLSVAYLIWMAPFAYLRVTHRSTSVARPWPFTEIEVYDPQGFYRRAGEVSSPARDRRSPAGAPGGRALAGRPSPAP